MRDLSLIFTFSMICFIGVAQNETLLWKDKGNNGKFGIVDKGRNVVIDYKFDEIEKKRAQYSSWNYLFKTKTNNKYGIIDKYGKEVITPQYDKITLHSQAADWIVTELNGKVGFAFFNYSSNKNQKKGSVKEVFKPKYDALDYSAGEGLSSGFVKVKLNNKWGLVNQITGEEITGMKYDEASDFSFYQGFKLTEVKLNGKYGIIDQTGKEIASCKYDEIVDLTAEVDKDRNIKKIEVRIADRQFFINENGVEVK